MQANLFPYASDAIIAKNLKRSRMHLFVFVLSFICFYIFYAASDFHIKLQNDDI